MTIQFLFANFSSSMLNLLAQAPAAPATGGGTTESSNLFSNPLFMFLPMILIIFLMFRSQRKRQKEQEAMLGALKKGDRVISSSGLYGYIAEVKERTLRVTIAEGVVVEMDKAGVAAVANPKKDDSITKK